MIGKTITIKDHTGTQVTRRVLGIHPSPTLDVISCRSLKGEHFILAGPEDSLKDRTYAPTSSEYKVEK